MRISLLLVVFALFPGFAGAQQIKSYLPDQKLGRLLFEQLDLKSFRSSFGPKHEKMRTLLDLVTHDCPSAEPLVTDKMVELNCDEWHYRFSVAQRGDLTGDGVEDLELAYIDEARNGGTYRASGTVTVTRYSSDGRVVFSGREELLRRALPPRSGRHGG